MTKVMEIFWEGEREGKRGNPKIELSFFLPPLSFRKNAYTATFLFLCYFVSSLQRCYIDKNNLAQ